MIDFPKSTVVNKKMPKEALYRNLNLTAKLREKVVSDIDAIYIGYSLTNKSLNLTGETKVMEILVLEIWLKKQEMDEKILEAIAKQNAHKLVFVLRYEGKCQIAVYYGKLYRTALRNEEEIQLAAKGYSLDEIWEHMVEDIALVNEQGANVRGMTLDERLRRQEQINKLKVEIEKTEKAAWKESQPKKQFELYTRLQTYKEKLEEVTHG